MKRGRNYTAGERAILIIGQAAGASLEEINEVIERDQVKLGVETRLAPKGSYESQDQYSEDIGLSDASQDAIRRLWEHIKSPKTWGELTDGGRSFRRRRAHATDSNL